MAKSTLIACHDAGAAEIIAAWVKRRPRRRFLFLLKGPAVGIFERKLGFINRIQWEGLEEEVLHIKAVITGTSWASDLDKKVIAWAKRHLIPSTTFLDHWTHYRERFETVDGFVLPDQIVVHDEVAEQKAREELKHPLIQREPNPYLEEIVKRIQDLEKTLGVHSKRAQPLDILYVAQPIEDVAEIHTGRRDGFGYSEFEALDGFIDWLKSHATKVREFRIRPHPSEKPGKYEDFAREKLNKLNVTVSLNRDLAHDVAWSDWVVGCDTMALVIALMADRKVFSCIPKGGRRLEIPLPGIKRLFE